jgi:hypothetical protein
MGRKRLPKYDDAYQSYLDGYSLEQVAEQLQVTRQCVYKAFKKRGYSLRGVNFRPHQLYDGKKFTLRNTGYYASTTDERCLMHRYVWELQNGGIPNGYDIHHRDRNKSNNSIENLELIKHDDHAKKYSTGNNQFTKK